MPSTGRKQAGVPNLPPGFAPGCYVTPHFSRQRRVSMAQQKATAPQPEAESDMVALLNDVGMQAALPLLVSAGFRTLKALRKCDEDALQQAGLVKVVQRRKLIRALATCELADKPAPAATSPIPVPRGLVEETEQTSDTTGSLSSCSSEIHFSSPASPQPAVPPQLVEDDASEGIPELLDEDVDDDCRESSSTPSWSGSNSSVGHEEAYARW